MQGKLRPWLVGCILLSVAVISGAAGAALRGGFVGLSGREPLIEGHVSSVYYHTTGTEAMAYALARHVPGGNGNPRTHLFARLYDNYLVLTNPEQEDWGPLVVPADKLIELRFTTEQNARNTMELYRQNVHQLQDHPSHDGHSHSDAGSSH
jgi:hypothetical protein